ncbi:hypothetical protein ACFL0J_04410 [Candidatus Neomarinimicrobiota bacterium]
MGIFKASKMGNKLARECAQLTKQIVNHLILKKYELKTHDTLYIFQESFTFLTIIVMPKSNNAKQHGNVIYVALDVLSDWLPNTLYKELGGNNTSEINKVLVDLPSNYFEKWIRELFIDNPQLKGGTNSQEFIAANDKYIHNVDNYIKDKFDKSPNDFLEFLSSITEQSVNILV